MMQINFQKDDEKFNLIHLIYYKPTLYEREGKTTKADKAHDIIYFNDWVGMVLLCGQDCHRCYS